MSPTACPAGRAGAACPGPGSAGRPASRHAAVCAPVQVVHGRAVTGALGQVTEARGWVVGDPPPGVEWLTLRPEAVLVILRSVQVDALVGGRDGLCRVRPKRVSSRPAWDPVCASRVRGLWGVRGRARRVSSSSSGCAGSCPRVRALCGSPIGDRRHGRVRLAGVRVQLAAELEPCEGASRLGVSHLGVHVEHEDEDAPRDLDRVR
eukprot:scaffold52558_cov27-Phaeocystis_antarctica.AAC.1